MSVLGRRLKEARARLGLSQEQLGLEAGLDPMSASTRMNRYELGKRAPDFMLMERIASVLGVPAAYFYTDDDDLARLILAYCQLKAKERQKVISFAEGL